MTSPEVLVIGAGFAGLSAATALAEAGVRVQVFEARPALGGRAAAFRDPVTGERVDNGQHVLAGCYTETLTFLRRIGSLGRLHRQTTLRVPMIDEDGRSSVLALPPLPSPINLVAGVLAWEAIGWVDRLSILALGPALRGRAPADPNLTLRQWLDEQRQSPRLCHMLWEPLALAALNQSADQAGVPPFLAIVRRMFGGDADAAAILVPAVPLDDLYAQPAAAFLRLAGSAVTTNAPVRIVVANDRLHAVTIRGETMAAPIVIAAVPWFALPELLQTPPPGLAGLLRYASTLASSPIVTVNLWLDGIRLAEPFVGLPGRTFQWVFDRRRIVGLVQTHLSLVSSGAEAICAAPNDWLIATAVHDLGTAWPAAAAATLRHATVIRERRATFSLRPGLPRRPGTTTSVPGLLIAGDWTDTGLPATIESAVQSGHAAAQAALRMLSR